MHVANFTPQEIQPHIAAATLLAWLVVHMNTCICPFTPSCINVAKEDDTDGTTVVFKGKAPVDSACTQKLHKVFLSSLIVCSSYYGNYDNF